MSNILLRATDAGRATRSRPHGLPSLAFVATLVALACSVAHAQEAKPAQRLPPPRAVVLPWYAEGVDPKGPEQLSASFEALSETLRTQGHEVLEPALIRLRLLAYGRFPRPFAYPEKAQFEDLARRALMAVASLGGPHGVDPTHATSARNAIERAMGFAHDHLESLNRDEKLAKKVLDTCLLTPRLMLTEGASSQLVVMEALQCLKMSPDVGPSPFGHPPEVQAALAKADMLSASLPRAVIEVSTSDRCTGCRVFLNGRALGQTPYRGQVMPGAYRIQIEYPGQKPMTGLIHEVTVSAQQTTRVAIAAFESHLRETDDSTFYVSAEDAHDFESLLQSLRQLLDVDTLVLARSTGFASAYAQVTRAGAYCQGRGEGELANEDFVRFLACAKTKPVPGGSSQRFATSLLGGRAGSNTLLSVRSRATRHWGFALLGVGAASVGAAGLSTLWVGDPNRDSGAREDSLRILAAGGSALMIASEPLWMPVGRKHAPWWAWTGMALGLAPVAYGAVMRSYDGDCATMVTVDQSAVCIERYSSKLRTTMVIAAGLPFVTLPLAHYVARRLFARGASVSAAVNYNAGSTSLLIQGKL